jgi:MFS family permease
LLLTRAALGDRFGRRRIYVTGLAIFTLASVACALAPNINVLIPARAPRAWERHWSCRWR